MTYRKIPRFPLPVFVKNFPKFVVWAISRLQIKGHSSTVEIWERVWEFGSCVFPVGRFVFSVWPSSFIVTVFTGRLTSLLSVDRLVALLCDCQTFHSKFDSIHFVTNFLWMHFPFPSEEEDKNCNVHNAYAFANELFIFFTFSKKKKTYTPTCKKRNIYFLVLIRRERKKIIWHAIHVQD